MMPDTTRFIVLCLQLAALATGVLAGNISHSYRDSSKFNFALLFIFLLAVTAVATLRLGFDIEMSLPSILRKYATHSKWWAVETVLLFIFGMGLSSYRNEPARKKRFIILTIFLLMITLALEYYYTGPVYFRCTDISSNGVVLQTFDSTCGPAAMATALRFLGINATEKELARLSRARMTGTSMDELISAAETFGVQATISSATPESLALSTPPVILALEETAHFVVFLGMKQDRYIIGDPSVGRMLWTERILSREWKGKTIVIKKK